MRYQIYFEAMKIALSLTFIGFFVPLLVFVDLCVLRFYLKQLYLMKESTMLDVVVWVLVMFVSLGSVVAGLLFFDLPERYQTHWLLRSIPVRLILGEMIGLAGSVPFLLYCSSLA